MRVNDQCAACLLDKQEHKTNDPEYLAEVKRILKTEKKMIRPRISSFCLIRRTSDGSEKQNPIKKSSVHTMIMFFPWKMQFGFGSNQTARRWQPLLPMPGLETILISGQ